MVKFPHDLCRTSNLCVIYKFLLQNKYLKLLEFVVFATETADCNHSKQEA